MEAAYSLDIVTVEDPFSLSFLLPSLEGVVVISDASQPEQLYPKRNSKQWKREDQRRTRREEEEEVRSKIHEERKETTRAVRTRQQYTM